MLPLILQYGIGVLVGHELDSRFSPGTAVKRIDRHHQEHHNYPTGTAVQRIDHQDNHQRQHYHNYPEGTAIRRVDLQRQRAFARKLLGQDEDRQTNQQSAQKTTTQSNSVLADVINNNV